MKDLIEKILREQTDDMGRTQSGRDALDAKTDKFKQKLRVLFTYMTTVGGNQGCRDLVVYYENYGHPTSFPFNNAPDNQKEMAVLAGKIEQGLKIIGLVPRNFNHFLLYTILVNYLHNGGSNRKFSEGDIELIPGKMYEVDVAVTETVTEYSTIMCDVYGSGKEDAEDRAKNNPWLYEVDRQTEDSDYHGDTEVEDVSNSKVEELNLTPAKFV
jgi:hypothetical protein